MTAVTSPSVDETEQATASGWMVKEAEVIALSMLRTVRSATLTVTSAIAKALKRAGTAMVEKRMLSEVICCVW